MLQINASIARHNQKVYCAFRTQHLDNYDARSYLTELDEDLNVISDKKLTAANNNTAFEDIRLFSCGESLIAFYNYLPIIHGKWEWQYAVGFGTVDPESGIIKNQISLRHLSKRFHEKNWTPYIFEGQLYMITDFDPYLRIVKIEVSDDQEMRSKEIHQSSIKTDSWNFGEIRGGTPLIYPEGTDNNWQYCFVHSFLPEHNGFNRYYFFTVLRFDPQTKEIEYYPNPLPYEEEEPDEDYILLWRLTNRMAFKVIFPIGIMNHDEGVIVSFGKDDVCSYTQYYTWKYIQDLFQKTE